MFYVSLKQYIFWNFHKLSFFLNSLLSLMIHILCISDSHKHFSASVEEYTKRLSKSLTITTLKPSRKDDPIRVLKEESTLLVKKLSKMPKPWILLEKEGIQYTSEEFSSQLEKRQWSCTIVIWWPFWVDLSLLWQHVDFIFSRWRQTMPHGLALVVLLEQIWRAKCIQQWKTYHY